jgi:hypothetical protein
VKFITDKIAMCHVTSRQLRLPSVGHHSTNVPRPSITAAEVCTCPFTPTEMSQNRHVERAEATQVNQTLVETVAVQHDAYRTQGVHKLPEKLGNFSTFKTPEG